MQVASLRANVTRLPQPLAGMMQKVADSAAAHANASSIAQISDAMSEQVSAPCQQIVANRYPFAKSERDVPMADFARLFAPNGVIDRFFAADLAPLVNLTGKTWTWWPNPNMDAQTVGYDAARVPAGGGNPRRLLSDRRNQPNVSLEVKPLTLSSDAQTATLSINGATVRRPNKAPTQRRLCNGPAPAPGRPPSQAPDMPDRKSDLERSGAWALFRLVEVGSAIQNGNAVKVSFVVGGREVSYQFTSASLNNPLTMASLRQFKCPNGL